VRLLLVTGEFPEMIGGVADHTAWLGQGLARLGHEVSVLTARDSRVVVVPGLDVRPVVTTWGGRELVGRCLESRPHVALLQYAPYLYQRLGLPRGLVSALGPLRRRVPVVLVAHELFIPWSGLRTLPLWLGQRLLTLLAVRRSDVTVVSTERRHADLRRAGVAAARLRLVRIGSSLPEPGADGLPDDPIGPDSGESPFRVGMFASLDLHWRRPDLVLEAVRQMGARRPGSTVELALMGRLPENTAGLLARFPFRGPGYRVEATGVRPAAELAARLRRCDAAVLLDTSGRGGVSTRSTSLASALALGRPLVANRGVETDSLFVDGRNVLFVPLSAEGVAGALERLRDDVALRRRVAAGGAELHREHLSSAAVAAGIDELCRSLASPGRGSRDRRPQ
jgi:glycosyltransferase involved in cell wall biosynthesis